MDQSVISIQERAGGVLAIPPPEIVMNFDITVTEGIGFNNRPMPRQIAYTLRDIHFGDFEVVQTDNAWWKDSAKVERLISAFKAGHIIKHACFYAGISERQWLYFNNRHPDFCRVQEVCESFQTFWAMDALNTAMRTDGRLAFRFLCIRHPKFKRGAEIEELQVQQPTQIVVSRSVDVKKIETELMRIADAFLLKERQLEMV
ncbi:MAG: hypothetical protein NTU85_00495 [Candidatus Kaiserbacteria bacterium]|nr:hypothetical protein [Candidatus Kaiserbacteria bacterium]